MTDVNVSIVIDGQERGHDCHPHHRLEHARWQLGPVKETGTPPEEGTTQMSFVLQANQQVSFSVGGSDAYGNPVSLTGTPVFEVDNTDILDLTDNGDGSGRIGAKGRTGSTTLKVTDSEGEKEFIGSIAVDIVAGNMTAVGVTLQAPEDIPSDGFYDQPADTTAPVDVPADPAPADPAPVDVPADPSTPDAPVDTAPVDAPVDPAPMADPTADPSAPAA